MYPTNWLHHLITEWQLYLSGCRGRNTCHHPWLLFRPVLSKSLGSALRRYPEFHCYSPPPLLHSSPTTTVSYLGYCAHLLVFLLLVTHFNQWLPFPPQFLLPSKRDIPQYFLLFLTDLLFLPPQLKLHKITFPSYSITCICVLHMTA